MDRFHHDTKYLLPFTLVVAFIGAVDRGSRATTPAAASGHLCPRVDAENRVTRARRSIDRTNLMRHHRATTLLATLVLALVSLSRAGDVDPLVDAADEQSDNYRSLVFGIKCGACKAVTREFGDAFARAASKHKLDAGPTRAFGSKYVSMFRDALSRATDRVCAADGPVAREWGYSEKGAESIIGTSRAFDRLGVNLTKEEAAMIQQTVFGLGIFTKEASARFRHRGPPGSDVPGSDNYSMISDSFARNTLREACSAVHDSLELDEAVDRAVANPDEGFDYSAQHKLCLELDYCRVRNRASGARRPVRAVEEPDGSVSYGTDDEDDRDARDEL